MGFIIFNGVSSEDLHILVQHPPEYVFPERDYEFIHVPGRNGDVILDNNSWQNVERTYNLAIDARAVGYTETAASVVSWLMSPKGYCRLEDSYEPDFYRLATYKNTGTISNIYRKAGVFDASFTCKPQRFYKDGEIYTTYTNGSYIFNPTLFEALPIIKIHGSGQGSFQINGITISMDDIIDGITLNSELQDAYNGSKNLNDKIMIDEFPSIAPGNNQIVLTGGVTSIEIKPRWWTL